MSLRPFFEASLAIQVHEIVAISAFILGGVILWQRKGNANHKFWGRIWASMMIVTAVTSIFIHKIKMWGDFSPIHLLTILTLITIPLGIWFARRGNFDAHRRVMQSTYLGGMVIAGGLTFLPGRMNFEMIFGPGQGIGSTWGTLIGLGAVIVFGLIFVGRHFGRKSIV